MLDREPEREQYQADFCRVARAFRHRFVDADGRLEGDTQTAYLLALAVGLLREQDVAGAVRRLVANVERRGTHIATGFLGVSLILPILTRYGHADLAYRLALQTSYPSWLYPIEHGATTVWERWDGWTSEKGFQSARMNSFNHYALGSVGEWLMKTVRGDRGSSRSGRVRHWTSHRCRASGSTGARRRTSRPRVRCEPLGGRQDGGVTYDVEIPTNMSARLVLPMPAGARLRRDGAEASPDAVSAQRASLRDHRCRFGLLQDLGDLTRGAAGCTAPRPVARRLGMSTLAQSFSP